MKIIPIRVQGLRKSKCVNDLLDDGSTVTLIHEKVIRDIGANCLKTDVVLKSFGSGNSISICNKKVYFQIVTDSNVFDVKNALVVQNLSLPKRKMNSGLLEYCAQKQEFMSIK